MRVQAIVARMVLERIALALVVRKPMATHLVQEEMRQEIIRAAAVVAIGVVGARVRHHNLAEQERVATPVAAADPVSLLRQPCLHSTNARFLVSRTPVVSINLPAS